MLDINREALHAAHDRLRAAVVAVVEEIHQARAHALTPYANPFDAAACLPRWHERLLQALDRTGGDGDATDDDRRRPRT
jgi:23S rRNA G2445 N2-methylase RlmL